MDKNEVLEKSRREYKNKDIEGIEAMSFAYNASTWFGLGACALLLVLALLFRGELNAGCLFIGWGMIGTGWLVKYIKLRRKKSELAAGIGSLALSIAWLVFYLRDLAGGL